MSKGINISLPQDQLIKFNTWTKAVSNENDRQVGTLVTGAILKLQARAIMFAPVDHGFLRSAIRPSFANNRKSGTVYANKIYAPFQEFGTRPRAIIPNDAMDYGINPKEWMVSNPKRLTNVRPNPFLLPAARLTSKEFFMKLKQMGFK